MFNKEWLDTFIGGMKLGYKWSVDVRFKKLPRWLAIIATMLLVVINLPLSISVLIFVLIKKQAPKWAEQNVADILEELENNEGEA